MKPRFRVLNPRGEELEVPTLDLLTRLFESGAVRADSTVHDALTGAWGPAWCHPVCRLILEELGMGHRTDGVGDVASPPADSAGAGREAPPPPAPPRPPPPAVPAASDGTVPEPGRLLDVELSPAQEVQEDTVQAFLEARERERHEEELREASDTGEVTLVDPAQQSLQPGPADFRNLMDRGRRQGYPRPHRPGVGKEESNPSVGRTADGMRGSEGPRTRRSDPSGLPRRSLNRADEDGGARQLSLFLLLIVIGTWGIADAWTRPVESQPTVLEAMLPPRGSPRSVRPGTLMPSEREIRAAAFEGMATEMERLRERMRVGEPPSSWMSGHYLAEASAYPEVESYWTRYETFTDTLREQEEDLFRAAFMERMRELGIQGSVLTVRQARALQDFRSDQPRREAHYGAMDELAAASLALHRFLEERSADIRYTPVDGGVTEDPVLEISTSDEATRNELWDRLDRLLVALDEVAGPDPDRRRDVTERILGTLADGGDAPDR